MFEIELFICIKMDLVLNNQQWLMCHKTKQILKWLDVKWLEKGWYALKQNQPTNQPTGMVAPESVLSMGQINLFDH